MASSAKATAPRKRKNRNALAGTRLPTNHVIIGNDVDSPTSLRLQLLSARYGVVGSYAALLAGLAWEGVQHV
jgi:hypothetical protein